jgi:hypothetical protein
VKSIDGEIGLEMQRSKNASRPDIVWWQSKQIAVGHVKQITKG